MHGPLTISCCDTVRGHDREKVMYFLGYKPSQRLKTVKSTHSGVAARESACRHQASLEPDSLGRLQADGRLGHCKTGPLYLLNTACLGGRGSKASHQARRHQASLESDPLGCLEADGRLDCEGALWREGDDVAERESAAVNNLTWWIGSRRTGREGRSREGRWGGGEGRKRKQLSVTLIARISCHQMQ